MAKHSLPLEEPSEKLLRCIQLQNKSVLNIGDWHGIKEEKSNKASKPILVAISDESKGALSKGD